MSPDDALRRAILDSLREQYAHRPVPTIREIVPPPGGASEEVSRFTLAWLSDGSLGASWNLLETPEDRGAYDAQGLEAWRGRDALEAAAELLRPERVRRILGFAAVGALSQGLFQDGKYRPDTGTDLVDLLSLEPNDRAGLVGYAPPQARRIADRVSRLIVLENREVSSNHPRITLSREPMDLAGCNKVLLTSTSLLNDTLGSLLEITRNASIRVLYGPGAGIWPEALFQRGLQGVAGMLFTDPERVVARHRSGERWGHAKQKFVLAAYR